MGCLSIIGGYIGVLGILGFLAFLWFRYGPSPEAADATYAWRQIAVNEWMAQAIALCARALRFAIYVQSGACTSMIAALILEKRFPLQFSSTILLSNMGDFVIVGNVNRT